MDPFSFVAPSRVRVLVLPSGKIKRSRFVRFVDHLRAASLVKLADVKEISEGNRATFSPKTFPQGQISYDLITTHNPDHEYLEGFELYRRAMIVIMVADHSGDTSAKALQSAAEEVKQQFPRALLHPLVIFDTPTSSNLLSEDAGTGSLSRKKTGLLEYPELTIAIPSPPDLIPDAVNALMADLSSLFLSELGGLSKSLQALPTIESPLSSSENWQAGPHGTRMSMPPSLTGGPNSSPSSTAASSGGRASMMGFGSGSLTDRSRSRGKGRVTIAIAHLHLLAGQVVDALREFIDGAAAAKAHNDHLWYSKAFEGAVICLVIAAYLGLEFKIPQLIITSAQAPIIDRSSKASTSSSTSSSSAAVSSQPSQTGGDGSSQSSSGLTSSPTTLFSLLPDILSNMLSQYMRAANFAGEQVPPLVYSETILRFSKLLVAGYVSGGLNEECLSHVIKGTKLASLYRPQGFKGLKKTEIASTVMRAYPTSLETLPLLDTARILGGISSILDMIGFHRRKALITRELVQALIPGLIQARVVGAAEIGVHPAASAMAHAHSEVKNAAGNPFEIDNSDFNVVWVEGLLASLCRSYGISIHTGKRSKSNDEDTKGGAMQSDPSISANLHNFGWHDLKINVLKSCIRFCEALPEYEGILRFTTALLEIAGRDLSKIEQGRLAESFTRTVGAARRSGLDDGKGGVADYWDEHLLRDIELVESMAWPAPIPHSIKDIDDSIEATRTDDKINPFIYNPFVRTPNTTNQTSKYIVQGEAAEFRVTLQNPYEFEIQVDKIELATDGVVFESASISTVIGPYRTYKAYVTGTPKESGPLRLIGCKVRVYGCVERQFPVIPEVYGPEPDTKTKAIGLAAANQAKERPASTSTISTNPRNSGPRNLPIIKTQTKELELAVLPTQPLLTLRKSSLPQSAIMVLEGERRVFTVTLENLSSTPADLVLFSFSDSTTGPIQAAISQKQAHPAEVYELELILLKKQAFTWLKPGEKPHIPATGEVTYEVEVLGKPGLTTGAVQIDYGHLGKPMQEFNGPAYTRQLLFPLTITVNASIELVRMDFLPFGTDLSFTSAHGDGVNGKIGDQMLLPNERFKELFRSIAASGNSSKYCLLLVDLRNSWPHPLQATLGITGIDEQEQQQSGENAAADANADAAAATEPYFTASDVIPAGHSTRIILPIRRVFIPNPHLPIPSHSGAQRQFVVSSQKFNPEHERQSREQFWYREELLKQFTGTWQEIGTSRKGQIDLRGFRLSPRMVDTVRIEDIGVHIAVNQLGSGSDKQSGDGGLGDDRTGGIGHGGTGRNSVLTNTFLEITVSVANRMSRSASLLLRLLPSLKHQAVSQDLSRKIVFDGNLQSAIGTVEAGETKAVKLGCLVLCAGEYEVGGGVEEINIGGEGEEVLEEIFEYDFGLVETTAVDRKLWVARETCTIVAKDEG